MPTPGTRSSRWASAAIALLLAACSGGGGGGGGSAAAPGAGSGAAATSSVSLAWGDASGPVAGYSIYVQRDEGTFKHELDVSRPSVTLRGAPGSTARVAVVAFDGRRAYGPSSPSSPRFTFPDPNAPTPPSSGGSGSGGSDGGSGSGGSDLGGEPAPSPSPTPTPSPSPSPAPALPGTMVWQAGDGFRLTDREIATTRLFARPYEGAQLAGTADFDADGHGDLLWLGPFAQLGFTSGAALRSGADPVPLVDLGLLADERILGAGDLDGDGDGDVLVATGDAVRARLTAPGSAPALVELGTATQAALAGIADFDGNGSEDIAWRASTGALVLWLLNAGSLAATVEVIGGALDWVGAGDFDGNGAAEIALRSPDGVAYVVHPLHAEPQLEPTDLANTSLWMPLGTADVDGDGSEEIVLASAGAVRIAGLPGDQVSYLEEGSPWQLVALLP